MKTLLFIILTALIFFAIYGGKLIAPSGMQEILMGKDTHEPAIPVASLMPARPRESRQKELSPSDLLHDSSDTSAKLPRDIDDFDDPEVKKSFQEAEKAQKDQTAMLNSVGQLFELKKSDGIAAGNSPLALMLNMLHGLKEVNDVIITAFWSLAALIIFFMALVSRTSISGIAYIVARFGFAFGRWVIFLLSIFSAAVWLSLRYNFFADFGMIFMLGLLALIVSSAASLKLYDYNNPVWNRMFISTIWPIAAGVIVQVF